MTSKQRAKIYRKVARQVFKSSHENEDGCCVRLGNELPGNYWGTPDEQIRASFPEFFLMDDTGRILNWWSLDSEGQQQRVLALLLSEQMALNP